MSKNLHTQLISGHRNQVLHAGKDLLDKKTRKILVADKICSVFMDLTYITE